MNWQNVLSTMPLWLPLLVVLLASLATRLTAYPKAGGLVTAIRVVLDVLSFLQHKDSPGGALQLPLVQRSTPPDQLPAAAPPVALILFAVLFSSSFGCAAFQRQPVALQKAESDALKCGLTGVQESMKSLTPTVLDALAGDSPDWQAQLDKLEVVGTNVLLCAVSHALFDAFGGDVTQFADLDRAVARRLSIADTTGVPPPTPTRRVLARGLQYLHQKLPSTALPARPPSNS